MPAKSKNQRRIPAAPAAADIAMTPGDLAASTPEAGLPETAKAPSSRLRPRPRERKPLQIKSTVRHIRKF